MPSARSRIWSAPSSGSPGTSPVDELLIAPRRRAARGTTEWKLRRPAPQVGRRSISSGRASVRMKMGKFRDHSSRYSTKSSKPASAQWRSSKTATIGTTCRRAARRTGASRRRDPPGRAARRSASPSRCASRGSIQRALVRVGDVQLDACAELRKRRLGRLLLEDAGARADHLGERPVGDALAVGKAAAAVPPDVDRRARRGTCRTPRRAATCRCPATADHGRTGCALRSSARGVEELLDHPQLCVASDERRLEADCATARRPWRQRRGSARQR